VHDDGARNGHVVVWPVAPCDKGLDVDVDGLDAVCFHALERMLLDMSGDLHVDDGVVNIGSHAGDFMQWRWVGDEGRVYCGEESGRRTEGINDQKTASYI
jgi:hypothetical protein